jgi:hypothetical protein
MKQSSPKQTAPVAFRNKALEQQLATRTGGGQSSAGTVSVRDLERYYAALRMALATVRLEQNEALLLADAANGTIWTEHDIRLLFTLAEDAPGHLATKWNVDTQALASKLKALTQMQCLAVVDALERFWLLSKGELEERLEFVGLSYREAHGRTLETAGLLVPREKFVTREEADAAHTAYLEQIGDRKLNLTDAVLEDRRER